MIEQQLAFADIGMGILFITLSVLIVAVVLVSLTPRKSKEYRMFLTDMYVSAKIRLLADKDGLKIPEEEEKFKAWSKKNRYKGSEYNLDDAVEDELKERVEEESVKTKK